MNRDSTGGRAWRTCLAVMLLALLIRGFLCAQLVCLSRDGVHFVTFARQLADAPVETLRATTKQPGYAYLLLGTHRLFGAALGGDSPIAWQRCGQLPALLGGVAVCGLIYWLTRRLFDNTTATIAAILAAFWWQGAQLSADALSDMPHLAIYLVAFLIGHAALRTRRMWQFAVCGLVCGAAYLLRQEAIGLLAAIGLCCLWSGQRVRDEADLDASAGVESGVSPVLRRPQGADATVHTCSRVRSRLVGLAVLVICFAAVVAPYAVAVGRIMPNKSPLDLLHGWPRTADAAGGPWFMLARIMPWWQTPLGMLEGWAKSGRYAISTLVLFGLLLRGVPRAESVGRRLVLAAILMQLLLVQFRVGVYGEISGRYMVIPLALSIPWAASGLVTLLNAIMTRLKSRGSVLKGAALTLGIVLPLVPQVCYLLRPIKGPPAAFAAAGAWLRENTKPDDRILAHDCLEQLMFYADRTYPRDADWLRFPETASLDETARTVEQLRPAWLVDAESARRPLGDEMSYLQSLPRGATIELEPRWLTGGAGERVYILRVVAQEGRGRRVKSPESRGRESTDTTRAEASRDHNLNDSRSKRPIGLASSRGKRTSCFGATPEDGPAHDGFEAGPVR